MFSVFSLYFACLALRETLMVRWWEWIWRCAKVQLWVCMCVILFNTTTYSSNWILRLETKTQQESISASSSLSGCSVTNGRQIGRRFLQLHHQKHPVYPCHADLPLEISLDNPISASSPQHTCKNTHSLHRLFSLNSDMLYDKALVRFIIFWHISQSVMPEIAPVRCT